MEVVTVLTVFEDAALSNIADTGEHMYIIGTSFTVVDRATRSDRTRCCRGLPADRAFWRDRGLVSQIQAFPLRRQWLCPFPSGRGGRRHVVRLSLLHVAYHSD